MRTQVRGLTVIELMIAVMIIGILGCIVVLPFILRGCTPPKPPAEEAAEWATTFGLKNPKIACTKVDTDMDGYISCAVQDGDGGQIYAIQCAAWGFNEGCKLAQPKWRP